MGEEAPHLCDTLSRFFDLVFAIGFGFLTVWFIISSDKDIGGLYQWTMIVYYCFWTIFCTMAFLEHKLLMTYCGFLKGTLNKAFFYAFLTSFAFAKITEWYAITVGSIDAVMTIVQFMKACGVMVKKEAKS